jgi:serine protease Do
MSSSLKAFLLGVSLALLILVSFFAGGFADRVFVLKPVDFLLRNRPNLLSSNSEKKEDGPSTLLHSDEKSVVDVASQASTSVVTVAIKKKQSASINPFSDPFFDFQVPRQQLQPTPQEGQEIKQDIGSGFVVDKAGLVVTNKHVVADSQAEYLVIDSENKEYKVSKIYRDPTNDLAILKVDQLNAPAIELGNSDSLKAGQSVVAIGTALGEFRHTVTTGVVSGLGRGIEAGDPFGGVVESLENVIQTDAAINPGNSGGPLLDSNGKVIGVNVAVSASGQNIGFAIPINVIKASLENFNQTGQFDRPFFGVRYRVITEKAALFNDVPQGDYITEVLNGSAADKAELKVGDIISQFDGKSLKDSDLAKLINSKKIGDKVKVKFWRKDQEKEVEVTLTGQS